MVRGGKIDVVVLGAYQVDEAGNVANWRTPEQIGGGIGGAMDLVASGRTVMVLMEHRDSRDRAKLVRSCTYPLTGADCVDIVVTDLAVLRRPQDGPGFTRIEDAAPGFTVERGRRAHRRWTCDAFADGPKYVSANLLTIFPTPRGWRYAQVLHIPRTARRLVRGRGPVQQSVDQLGGSEKATWCP